MSNTKRVAGVITEDATKRVPSLHSHEQIYNPWGVSWGPFLGNAWAFSWLVRLPASAIYETQRVVGTIVESITDRVTGTITDNTTKRMTAAITETTTKRVTGV